MKKILLLIIVIIAIISCEKDGSGKFTIGSEENAAVIKTDITIGTAVWGWGDGPVNIDVDKDGVADFELVGRFEHALGGFDYQVSSVKSMHDKAFVSSVTITDTIHDCWGVNDGISHHFFYNVPDYQCNAHDTIYRISDVKFPEMYYAGYSPEGSEIEWTYDEIIFAERNNNYTIPMPSMPYAEDNNIIYDRWNLNDYRYVLIRVDRDEKVRMGWIKLKVYNYSQIHISEYALEKP